jgi:hypothetical protein
MDDFLSSLTISLIRTTIFLVGGTALFCFLLGAPLIATLQMGCIIWMSMSYVKWSTAKTLNSKEISQEGLAEMAGTGMIYFITFLVTIL